MRPIRVKDILELTGNLTEIEIRTSKHLVQPEYIGTAMTVDLDKWGEYTVKDIFPLYNRFLIYTEE